MQSHILQQRADDGAWWGSSFIFVDSSIFHVACFEPLLDEFPCREAVDGLEQEFMVDVVEGRRDVSVQYPHFLLVASNRVDFFQRVVAASTRAEPIAYPFEPGFPEGF